jgi:hypothetical protein
MSSLAINPNYTQQGSRPLAVIFGYALIQGDPMIDFICNNGAPLQYIGVADGECDGIEQAMYSPTGFFSSTLLTGTTIDPTLDAIFPGVEAVFHSGQWTPIGMPTTPFSVGPDQQVDWQFGNIPGVTPPQSFSNICYVSLYAPPTAGIIAREGFTAVTSAQFFGIVRGARCRQFDALGNVTGYGFTTNPVWHRMEMLLRYKFKRQQPQIAGLTAAERALFDWGSISALAERNDFVLATHEDFGIPVGQRRFTGNYVFASNATLASMLETSSRCDRSYLDDVDGKIGMFGHDYNAAVSFAMTGAHIFPGSWKCEKKNLTNEKNVFIPKYRDLNIQALVPVVNATVTNAGVSDGHLTIESGIWGAIFDTNGQNPFPGLAVFWYGDGSNPALNHDYVTIGAPPAIDLTPSIVANVGSDISTIVQSSTGGYIGMQTSRFAPRSPNTVQHSRHQAATASPAPGLVPLANIAPRSTDYGNMSYDQANRLSQYLMNRTLGLNVPGWVAPQSGSVRLLRDAIDANGNKSSRLRPFEKNGIITIDDTVSPEQIALGNTTFMVTALTQIPPSKKEPNGAVEVEFTSVLPEAGYPDTSYAPTSDLLTIASAALHYVNSTMNIPYMAWVIKATPSIATAGDGTLTLTIPDLTMQFVGAVGFAAPVDAIWAEIPVNTVSTLLYCPSMDLGGGLSSLTPFLVRPGSLQQLISGNTLPENSFPILSGTFTATAF